MANREFPPLCGGVFFRILLGYRKQRLSQKAYYSGEKDTRSNIPVLLALIQVTAPSFQSPKQSTIKTNTSAFLNCREEVPGTLPFCDAGFIASFRGQMKDHYPNLLYRMSTFLDYVIGLEDKYRLASLVKEVVEIMEHDPECRNAKFYIGPNRESATPADISDISFQSFMLGVWYYIISKNRSNKIRESLYDEWARSKQKGSTVTRQIHVEVQTVEEPEQELAENYEEENSEEETIQVEPEIVEVQDYSTPFFDPISQRQIMAQFHVENHGSGAAVGINYGGIHIGGKKKDE